MTKINPLPTQQELHEWFDYSVITGDLYWKEGRCKNKKVLGLHPDGYLRTRLNKKNYMVHRLIWCWVTGEDPGTLQVDHINGQRDCNAWHNLRLVTNRQNQLNNHSQQKGYTNATGRPGWYQVRITVEGRRVHVGYFQDPVEATAAYREAHALACGEFSPYSPK